MSAKDKLVADAVFEGESAKGVAYAGVLEVFEQAGYNWKNVA